MNRLLSILSENSSFTTEELAMMLARDKEDVEEEVKNLEKSGIIQGYRAIVNWEEVTEPQVTAFIELRVTPERDTGFDNIARKVAAFDEVENVYLMAGAFDLAVFVKCENIQEVAMFVSQKLSTIHGVLSTATHFLLKRYKENGVDFSKSDDEQDKRSMIL